MLHVSNKIVTKTASSVIFQKSLLCGVSLIAAGVLVGPRVAQAQAVHAVSGITGTPVDVSPFGLIVDPGALLIGAPGVYNLVGNSTTLVSISALGDINSIYTSIQSAGIVN
ncbi:MAG: hypothetical protein POG74_11695 [Acidocella sp.]|nr:hypothetical protein [Acidocella sp.]